MKRWAQEINFEGQVDIMTLEQFWKFFNFECLDKNPMYGKVTGEMPGGIDELNERIKEASEHPAGLLSLRKYKEEKEIRLNNILAGELGADRYLGRIKSHYQWFDIYTYF